MNNIEYYNMLSIISLVMFVILAVMAVVMWFKLDIMHYFAVLTGSEAKRSIDKIRKDAASGEIQADRHKRNKAVVSWNTSDSLDNSAASISRKLASVSAQTRSQSFDPEKTTVLGQADPYATTVLSQLNQAPATPQPVVATPVQKPATVYAQPVAAAPMKPAAPAPAVNPQPAQSASSAAAAYGFVVEKEIINTIDNGGIHDNADH